MAAAAMIAATLEAAFGLGGGGVLFFPSVAAAADFRIVNTVSAPAIAGATVPVPVVSQMIFIDGVVYNFIDPHGELTVYDAAQDTLVVIDPELRLQTRLPAAATRAAIDETRKSLVGHRIPLVAFAAQPEFRQSLDPDSGTLKMTSELFDYEVETTPAGDPSVTATYYGAADMFCYLNFRLQPGPLALKYLVRLDVNQSLREAQRLPKKITLDFYPKGKGLLAKAERYESRHEIFGRLSDADRKRLDQARNMMQTFRTAAFDEYQREVEKKLQLKQEGKQGGGKSE